MNIEGIKEGGLQQWKDWASQVVICLGFTSKLYTS